MEPVFRLWNRLDGLLEPSRLLRAKALPVVARQRVILHGVRPAHRVGRFEIERPEEDGVVCLRIHGMECHTDKAPLRYVPPTKINFDCAVSQRHIGHERQTYGHSLAQSNDLPAALDKARRRSIEGAQLTG